MTAEEILGRYLPPSEHQDFVQQIRALPEGVEKWLYAASYANGIWQGDVLSEMELTVVEVDRIEVYDTKVIVVSNTCDLVPGQDDYGIVAPVFELSTWVDILPPEGRETRVRLMRCYRINRYFYLPAKGTLPESYVDLSRLCSVSLDVIRARAQPIVSLSLKGFLLFPV